MSADERVVLTHGIIAVPFVPGIVVPADAVLGAGYVPGIARLGVPALRESDASLGVAYVMGIRKDGSTPLPSGLAQAASWNPDILFKGGAMIGSEARAKGFNVLLAGGANLTRDPRNGRTFEYLSEDPLLTGVLVGSAIRGIQSNDIISTIKHFALNGQETGRKFVNSVISESAARESDLLAFQIGIEQGQPGSVMCSYNVVNGAHGCDSDWLLNKVLKRDWRYKGFVMSDWGAVPSLDAALNGLDQQSGEQLDPKVFFAKDLQAKAASDPAYAAKLVDMNTRILSQIFKYHLDTNPAKPSGAIDFAANGAVALAAAEQGIVLLRNQNGALPLAASAKRIAVIGGFANSGVMSGAGSSQVQLPGGPAVSIPLGGDGPFAAFMQIQYHASAPLKAIKALAPEAQVIYRDGSTIADAVAQAKTSDVAIVFATKWSTEGQDSADFSLPNGQDALIAAVAEANPNTIVVLETGNPVDMPWLGKTAAVIEAWFPGGRGGEAIANVLFGKVNPSGHLPITFPASAAQLPRSVIDGYFDLEPNFAGDPPTPDTKLDANYNIEGSDVGYRWFARNLHKALFPFGFGLSYTTFASSGLKVSGMSASFTVQNTGSRQGATVGQVYLVSRAGAPKQRLAGFARVDLQPGASQTVKVTFDPRILADWKDGGWSLPAGAYTFALGDDAEHLGTPVTVRMAARSWKD
ncbi:glycoside hydrolase family 3 C-terminal domain-containing protein [Novosphingobium sp. PASSN1]|uniref:beta-glucosidase family protein n=1 Tax=Novosphingobium sp. PASSN1 TaxID=2015561 RepID=UPI0025DCE57C|nr:glycoside hydrolase family 3 C-terminal domain-containing protein [Novosphingobium sp. PASSN1]